MNTETPIRKQYLEIKKRHRDAILLFRIGDFYEAFDDDARLLARELDIVLTSKPMGKGFRAPLSGVPFHSLERHLATLIAKGHRVAICEQLTATPTRGEDGKRLIERDVVRVVTPGTVLEPGLLDSKTNNYIAAFYTDGRRAGIAYADVTTGDFAATEIENSAALIELQRIAPAEILLAKTEREFSNQDLPGFVTLLDAKVFASDNASKVLQKHFGAKTLEPFGLSNQPLAVSAAAAILFYLRETQSDVAEQLTRLTAYDAGEFLTLDANTVRSLEIFESASGASLLSILDRTRTAMGGRLLRRWLRQPLMSVAEIVKRQEHVQFFVQNRNDRAEIANLLENLHDIERSVGRARANLCTANELLALGKSLRQIPKIRGVLQRDAARFGKTLVNLPTCEQTANLIEKAIADDFSTSEKIGIIRTGFSEELDKLRKVVRDGKTFLADLEARERARSGIKSLRVTYNKVFGYFIEVTKPNLHLVPSDFVRKQTLVNAERFVTLELKEYESLVLNSQERLAELENGIFRQVCTEIGKNRQQIIAAAQILARLDAIVSLAEIADQHNYVRPHVSDTSLLRIKNGRHAVVERAVENFVANDAALGGVGDAPQISLITGPNASGKSTYLRQIALIVLLAQIGSFVPADEAVIGLCDRIFTRIGLYDRIGAGESTFMTEMVETAEILHNATPRSLILLDELGRGTSTYDGLAVARAVVEFIHNHPNLHSRTLFATHYHELAELADLLPRLENLHVEIEENGDELTFRYKVSRGVALRSYGVYAAKLAGLPKPVVRRAESLLKEYEKTNREFQPANSKPAALSEIEDALLEIDLNNLSPVEAMMKLYELKALAGENQANRTLKTA